MTDVAFALSNSEIQTAQTCTRKWWLAYYRRLQVNPVSVSPVNVANLGNHVHLALEAYHGHQLDPLAVLRWDYDRWAEEYPAWETDLVKERDYALAMLEGYLQWAEETGLDVDVEVLATEKEVSHVITLPTQTRVLLRGKLDQLVRRRSSGALLLRDFKTVGGFEKGDLLVMNQQMRHYAMLLSLNKNENEFVAGALYLMIKRSKRTTRATPPFYEQLEIGYNRHDLNSTYQRVIVVATEIEKTRKLLDHGHDHHEVVYPNFTDACSWGCPFVKVCPLFDDGSRVEGALQANYVVGDPYQYLSRGKINEVLAAFGQPEVRNE